MSLYCTALIARNQETAPVDVNIWQKLIRSDNLWSVLAAAFVLIKEIALPMKCDQMILFWWIIPGFMSFLPRQAGTMHLSDVFSTTKTPKKLKQFPIFPPTFFQGTFSQKGSNFNRDFVLKIDSNELHWLWHHWNCNAEKINSDDFGIVGNCSNGWSLAPNTLLIKS